MSLFTKLNKPSIKISFIIALASLFCALSVFIINGIKFKELITRTYEAEFKQFLEIKKEQLEGYFESLETDAIILASNETVTSAAISFNESWRKAYIANPRLLQDTFINNNPNSRNERDNLSVVDGNENYFAVHAQFHGWLREFAKQKELNDILLIDTDGNITYSVYKGFEFGLNVLDEFLKSSTLSKIYNDSLETNYSQNPSIYDFNSAQKDEDKIITYVSIPIKVKEYNIGTLVLEISSDKIFKILSSQVTSGETASLLVVGSDYNLRNQPNSNLSSSYYKDEAVIRALSGISGSAIIKNTRDEEVFSYYVPFNFGNLKWAMVNEINTSEIYAPLYSMENQLFLVISIIILIASGAGIIISNRIIAPFKENPNQMPEEQRNIKVTMSNNN